MTMKKKLQQEEAKTFVTSFRQQPFTMVANAILTCPEISSKAFRVYSYLCSRANMNWEFYNHEIVKNMDFSEWTLKGVLKELEDINLIERIYHKDSQFRYSKREIKVRLEITKEELDELIQLKNKNSKKPRSLDIVESAPLVENPPVELPPVENLPTYKEKKKEIKNKEKSLPTMNEIKKECEREKYFIDEEKFFKWCCKVGNLKSSWQSVLMSWAENPINKVLPSSNKPLDFNTRLKYIFFDINDGFEIRNNLGKATDWRVSDFKLENQKDVIFYYPDEDFLDKYKITIDKLKIQRNVKFKIKQ